MPYTSENRARIKSLIKTKSKSLIQAIHDELKNDDAFVNMIAENAVAGLKKNF